MLKSKKLSAIISGYVAMLFGCIFYSLSTVLFLAPRSIVAGGITGLSVLINILNSNFPIGIVSIVLNLPILVLGFKYEGWKFILKCLVTIVVLGLVTDLFTILIPPDFIVQLSNDSLLSSLYGGICQGIGIGLFVRFEFSSGGTELLGRVITKWIKWLKIPVAVAILDAIIVIVGAIFTNTPNNMLYALIVIFVSTKVSEFVLVGIEKSKLCLIISDKGEEISQALIERSPRGVTMLEGQGMYTKKEHNVLVTCVKNRQLAQLKHIVKDVDPNAFIVINDSVEVRGKGFKSLNKE